MWLVEIFNRLFPPPPLYIKSCDMEKETGGNSNDVKCNDVECCNGYIFKDDLDRMRSSLASFDFMENKKEGEL